MTVATAPPPVPKAPDEKMNPGLVIAFLLGLVAIVIAGFVAVAAIALAFGDDGGSSAAVPSTTIEVELVEFAINGNLTAPAGDVQFAITNKGTMVHNVAVMELGVISADINAGRTGTLDLGRLEPGVYEVSCEIPGHASSGMVATLTITGDSVGAAAPDDHAGMDHGGDDTDWAALDAKMMESMLAFPAETEGKGNPVLEPTEVLTDGTKVFDLVAERVDWEVEPGKFVDAWTYNGVVPAPQIILDRGDKVQFRVVNNLPMGTDIHWHGVHTPNDQDGVAPYTQDLIEPNGGTFTYEFVAEDDAIGMYHAHNHAQMQVVNGMFGAITIGDNPIPYGATISGVTIPDDIEPVVNMPMVLNDAGTIGFSLNGKSFPATEPLVLNQGDWATITYYNEGLQIHPMHLHQFPPVGVRKGRRSAGSAALGGHLERRPRRAVHRAVQGRRCRHLGVALPHLEPCRKRGRDVRHGHRHRGAAEPRLRS